LSAGAYIALVIGAVVLAAVAAWIATRKNDGTDGDETSWW
jgi:hypothetical protein